MVQYKYISNLSLNISQYSSLLSAMEKDMIQTLMKQRHKFTYKKFTIAYISEVLNVSSTSLHRLSKKLGYSSFTLFREDYFADSQVVEEIKKQDTYETLLNNTCYLVRQSLNEEMISILESAKNITIYGMGISSFIGKIYQKKLELLGIRTQQYDDSRFMRISSRRLEKDNDVIILLSRSGKPPELIEVLMETNKRVVPSILITEEYGSPLANMATYVIYTSSVNDHDNNIDTRLHAHIAMDMLIEKVIQLKRKGKKDHGTI